MPEATVIPSSRVSSAAFVARFQSRDRLALKGLRAVSVSAGPDRHQGGTMGFFQSSFRARLPVRRRAPIFAVGWRAYVASPGDGPAPRTSADEAGADGGGASMVDGTEVEILAWRPRSSGTRYRVRSTCAGLEGWLG